MISPAQQTASKRITDFYDLPACTKFLSLKTVPCYYFCRKIRDTQIAVPPSALQACRNYRSRTSHPPHLTLHSKSLAGTGNQ
jgi:hypothetical protein